MGCRTGRSQCWVLPGTGVPLLHASTSCAAVAPTSAPKRWVTSAMAAVAVAERAGLAAGAGQFDRRRQLQRVAAAWWLPCRRSAAAGRRLVGSGGAAAGGEQVVVHLQDEQAAGLQPESDVVLQEGLGGAGRPGVDPRRLLLLAVQAGVAEAGPALAPVVGVLGAGRRRVRGRDPRRRSRGARSARSAAGTGCRSGTSASVRRGSITKQRYSSVPPVGRRRRVGPRHGQVEEPLAGAQRLRRLRSARTCGMPACAGRGCRCAAAGGPRGARPTRGDQDHRRHTCRRSSERTQWARSCRHHALRVHECLCVRLRRCRPGGNQATPVAVEG